MQGVYKYVSGGFLGNDPVAHASFSRTVGAHPVAKAYCGEVEKQPQAWLLIKANLFSSAISRWTLCNGGEGRAAQQTHVALYLEPLLVLWNERPNKIHNPQTFPDSFAPYLAEMGICLLNDAWIASASNVRQIRFYLLDVAVHGNNSLGSPKKLPISRPRIELKISEGFQSGLERVPRTVTYPTRARSFS